MYNDWRRLGVYEAEDPYTTTVPLLPENRNSMDRLRDIFNESSTRIIKHEDITMRHLSIIYLTFESGFCFYDITILLQEVATGTGDEDD